MFISTLNDRNHPKVNSKMALFILKRYFFPILFGILGKISIFAPLICKQKEFRGSVYLDIYRALRLLLQHLCQFR